MYYMCVDMCSSYGGQKRVTDALELELRCWASNQALWKSNQCP